MKLSSTKNAAFHCDFTRFASDAECYRLKILKSDLEETVLKGVRQQARAIIKSAGAPSQPQPTEGNVHIKHIEEAKRALYERYVLGEIGAEEYNAAKTGLDTEHEQMKSVLSILAEKTAKKAAIDGLRQIATDTLKVKKLLHPVVDALIDKVLVFPGNRVEVVWKLSND
jgi:hypothetical protein